MLGLADSSGWIPVHPLTQFPLMKKMGVNLHEFLVAAKGCDCVEMDPSQVSIRRRLHLDGPLHEYATQWRLKIVARCPFYVTLLISLLAPLQDTF